VLAARASFRQLQIPFISEARMSRTSTTGGSADTVATAELFFPDFDGEHTATRRMLERFPDEQAGWRPHEHSRTIGELANHIASIPMRGVDVLTADHRDILGAKPAPPVATASELVARLDENLTLLREALGRADRSMLDDDWSLRRGEQVILHGPRRQMMRTVMMSHLIHHRAQLGVYYRLLGVPVPGMYGPSADEMASMTKGR
jgi:uncharacterized damage-inducible protein DinB